MAEYVIDISASPPAENRASEDIQNFQSSTLQANVRSTGIPLHVPIGSDKLKAVQPQRSPVVISVFLYDVPPPKVEPTSKDQPEPPCPDSPIYSDTEYATSVSSHKAGSLLHSFEFCVMIIFAIIFPPLTVYLIPVYYRGTSALFLSIFLTCLGFFPGVIHACYMLSKSLKRP